MPAFFSQEDADGFHEFMRERYKRAEMEKNTMSFTKKSSVVARLDTVRQEAKVAALKRIEETMRSTKIAIFTVDLGAANDLHADDLQFIVEGYRGQGWTARIESRSVGRNEDSVLVIHFS